MTDKPTPADKQAAEADIAAMRQRLRGAVNACTDLAMDQAVLILETHRLRRLLAEAEKRRFVILEQRRAATSLLEYALHLRQHGENAPGGDETWRQFDTRAEDFLRTNGAAAALSAATAKQWADLAYDMWDLLGDSVPAGGVSTDRYGMQRGLLRRRLAAILDEEPVRVPGPSKIENGWCPTTGDDGKVTLSEAVGQAIGTASMCWEHVDKAGVFDDAQASWVYDGIMAFLSDWADEIRKQANEATAAKMLTRENWT